MSQHEEPRTAGQLATIAILQAKHGGLMSGGRMIDFREGWALPRHGKVHHLRVTGGGIYLISACGRVFSYHAQTLMGPGNFPVCKPCERAMKRVK